MGFSIFVLALLIDIFIVARTILILLGRLKGSVLQSLGRYGEEPLFYPLSNVFFALSRLAIWIIFVAGNQRDVHYPSWLMNVPVLLLGIIFVLLSYLQTPIYRTMKKVAPKFTTKLLWLLAYYPSWYRDLYERTSRYERRRIAYMWLRLSPQTRDGFDLHTPSFLQWTDLIVMGTVMEEDKPMPVQAPVAKMVTR